MKLTKIGTCVAVFFLMVPIVLAQDWRSYLEALLGELPDPCVDLQDPLCWKCLGLTKAIPLGIFTIFGWVIIFITISKILFPGKPVEWKKIKEYKVWIVMIPLIIGIFLMHFMGLERFFNAFGKIYDFLFWIKWGIIFGIFLSAYYGIVEPTYRGSIIAVVFIFVIMIFMGRSGLWLIYILIAWTCLRLLWKGAGYITNVFALKFLLVIIFSCIIIGVVAWFHQPIHVLFENAFDATSLIREKINKLSYTVIECF